MRMFDRLPREEDEEVLKFVSTDPDPTLEQAIDTVARRLNLVRAAEDTVGWGDFPDIGEHDWDQVDIRARELAEEQDRGQEAFEAAYKLLEQRAEHDA